MPSLVDNDSPAKKCYYLASKGARVCGPESNYMERQSASWLSKVQLQVHVNNHVDTTVPYLIEQLGANTIDNIDEDGNTPCTLQLFGEIVW